MEYPAPLIMIAILRKLSELVEKVSSAGLFWELPRDKRDQVRAAFQVAYRYVLIMNYPRCAYILTSTC